MAELATDDLAAADGSISLALSGSTFATVATAAVPAALTLGTFFAAFVGTDLTGLAVGAARISVFAGALATGAGIFAGLARATASFVSLTAGAAFALGWAWATLASVWGSVGGVDGAALTVFLAGRVTGVAAGELGLGPGPEAGEPGLDGVFTGAESRRSARRVQRFCNVDCGLEQDQPAAISGASCR